MDNELDKKKNELFSQGKELEKVYIDNERIKDELLYI